MSDEMPITYYRMGNERLVVRNPSVVTDGIMLADEAFLVIDTNKMPMEFQRQLFHHIQAGNIKVQVAEVIHE